MSRAPASSVSGQPKIPALGKHLIGSLDKRWRKYRDALECCREHASEESVHDLRVETRRLLSMLELLRTLADDDRLKKTRRILKKRLDAFDDLRDTQVRLAYIGRMLKVYPELKRVKLALRNRERRLIKQTARKLRGSKTAKLAKRISTVRDLLEAEFEKPKADLRNFVKVMESAHRAFEFVAASRRRIDPLEVTTIHLTRLAFKKFRYMVELLQPVLPGISPEQLPKMHRYQSMMGDIQDIEILCSLADKLTSEDKAENENLQAFRREMARRRVELIHTYLESADLLFSFWPAKLQTPAGRDVSARKFVFNVGPLGAPSRPAGRKSRTPSAVGNGNAAVKEADRAAHEPA